MIRFKDAEPVKSKEAARKPGDKGEPKLAGESASIAPPEADARKPAAPKRKKGAAA
jgi:hypothetical protein